MESRLKMNCMESQQTKETARVARQRSLLWRAPLSLVMSLPQLLNTKPSHLKKSPTRRGSQCRIHRSLITIFCHWASTTFLLPRAIPLINLLDLKKITWLRLFCQTCQKSKICPIFPGRKNPRLRHSHTTKKALLLLLTLPFPAPIPRVKSRNVRFPSSSVRRKFLMRVFLKDHRQLGVWQACVERSQETLITTL